MGKGLEKDFSELLIDELKQDLFWGCCTGRLIGRTGSPSKTRTCDKTVNSRLLYQLSYRGTR
jgi:hypothetical protein